MQQLEAVAGVVWLELTPRENCAHRHVFGLESDKQAGVDGDWLDRQVAHPAVFFG